MCADSTSVRVEEAPGFVAPARAKISVFGVFHDGRMSEPAWFALADKVSHALDSPRCEVGYDQPFRNAAPDLARDIDRQIRSNGIDDSVLARVAPFATGDYVMVLMSYRQIPVARHHADAGATARPAAPMARGARGRFGAGTGASSDYDPALDDRVFELSASLYSIADKKLVAQIDLRHNGDDLDAAMDAFAQKLDALVPRARCVGWKFPAADTAPDDASDAGLADDAPPD